MRDRPWPPAWDKWHERADAHKKEQGISDAEISAVVNSLTDREAKRAQINHIMLGKRDPTLSQFLAVCFAVGLDPGDVLFKAPAMKKPPKPLVPPKVKAKT